MDANSDWVYACYARSDRESVERVIAALRAQCRGLMRYPLSPQREGV
jgi:hypothetical protein